MVKGSQIELVIGQTTKISISEMIFEFKNNLIFPYKLEQRFEIL